MTHAQCHRGSYATSKWVRATPDLRWLHDVGRAVRALYAKLSLNGARLLLRLFWRDEAVHDYICACPSQALQHAESYALRGPCSSPNVVSQCAVLKA